MDTTMDSSKFRYIKRFYDGISTYIYNYTLSDIESVFYKESWETTQEVNITNKILTIAVSTEEKLNIFKNL